ncbi:hypothetical protein BK126_04680 [Paenibacillus sp. FSL H7-0326]|uniref:TniQ family protein n=1 Tax=Paenibacillus sp. FSL H7-0326 TaxID=1921144 RepID=UPI00096D31A6|nr:TniQ family protein [Paenibacillus sp. FSL H7-0326]OMC71395.1 hypothetical protein BK126_04680 [Paenibacillus sp. FSL H7-0326]
MTIRKKIRVGESLHSFLLRSAKANGIGFFNLINLVQKNKKYNLHRGDVHRLNYCPSNILELKGIKGISSSTLLDIEQASFNNVLSALKGNSKKENSKFLNDMFNEYLHFCPDCYKDDLQNKLIWEVLDIEICVKHKKKLQTSCCYCNKHIYYKDILQVGICPYCNEDLSKQNSKGLVLECPILLYQQTWLYRNWTYLINYSTANPLRSNEIALRLLYVLNNFYIDLCKQTIRDKISELTFLHYLHYARGTNKKGTVHLRTILSILFNAKLDVDQYFEMVLPEKFIRSVTHTNRIKASHYCIAPWCSSYMQDKSIITTLAKSNKVRGEIMKRNLVCKSCGCEYAINSNNFVVERTNFIKGYDTLNKRDITKLTWPEREKIMGLKKGRIRRVLAYFSSRNLFIQQTILLNCKLDDRKTKLFIQAIQHGESIHNIQHWKCWINDDEYILHRYHPETIVALCEMYYSGTKVNEGSNELHAQVVTICKKLSSNDQIITLSAVSKAMGLSVTSIHNKGYSTIVGKYKKEQQIFLNQERKDKIIKTIDELSVTLPKGIAYSEDIYVRLGVCRVTLKKIDPQLCIKIDSFRKEWNKKYLEMNKEG